MKFCIQFLAMINHSFLTLFGTGGDLWIPPCMFLLITLLKIGIFSWNYFVNSGNWFAHVINFIWQNLIQWLSLGRGSKYDVMKYLFEFWLISIFPITNVVPFEQKGHRNSNKTTYLICCCQHLSFATILVPIGRC